MLLVCLRLTLGPTWVSRPLWTQIWHCTVSATSNGEHLTIFKPYSSSCLVWNGILVTHDARCLLKMNWNKNNLRLKFWPRVNFWECGVAQRGYTSMRVRISSLLKPCLNTKVCKLEGGGDSTSLRVTGSLMFTALFGYYLWQIWHLKLEYHILWGLLYTPQQNGVAEHVNRVIVKMARGMFHAQNLDELFWTEAVVNAVYTRFHCPTKALDSITPEEAWNRRQSCIAYMRVFGWLPTLWCRIMKNGKLNANDTKCLFLGYCEGTQAYRVMYLQTKKIIKNWDMIFMKDGTSVWNALEMRSNKRNEGSKAVVVDESFKSSSCDDGEERKEQVGDHLVANEERIETLVENDSHVERFGKDGKYFKREQPPSGEWWKNHINLPTSMHIIVWEVDNLAMFRNKQ